MTIRTYTPILAFLLLFLLSCSKDDNNGQTAIGFTSKYGGKPYQGEAVGTLKGADGNTLYRWEGAGTAVVMEPKGDSISIAFMVDFNDEGEVNFKFSGIQEGLDFQMEADNSYFEVINGNIDGHVKNDFQDMRFEGTLTEAAVQLTVAVLFVKSINNFPQGATLTISFNNVQRVVGNDDGGGCEIRMVPIWGPNGMTMGMVPDC